MSIEIHVSSIVADGREFTSINQAIAEAKEGDIIVVHEGVYRETVEVTKSNLTIMAYEDDYVLVTGNDIVETGKCIDNIYVSEVAKSYDQTEIPYSQVFMNGKYQTMARFPKLTIE
ncbi:hypothetical protein AN643_01840 [Candidatus Epulonipiscioides saccharophilum]|nr:hypothetical protein AN643_01840 [Epulopiscium sp. SCG-B10WGA-EpuloB]